MDYLQQKNRELERRLADSQAVAEEAETKYSRAKALTLDLEYQLQGVDRAAAKLQTDKDVVIRAADREMGEAKVSGYSNHD